LPNSDPARENAVNLVTSSGEDHLANMTKNDGNANPCARPSIILTAQSKSISVFAAIGVNKVKKDVINMLAPNNHFPPIISANLPPGNCVKTYP